MIRKIGTVLLLTLALAAYWRLLRRFLLLVKGDDPPRREFVRRGPPAGSAMIVPSG